MSDLSTYAGQVDHYAAVKARLSGPRNVPLQIQPQYVSQRPRVLYAPIDLLGPPNWRTLLRLASLRTGVSEDRIMSRQRDVASVHARFMTWSLMRRHLEASLPMISARWGFDHSSALHGIRKYDSGQSLKRMQAVLGNPRNKPKDPERVYRSAVKWTPEEKAEAQAMRDDGMLLEGIANWFGVSRNAVQAMLKRHAAKEKVE